MNPIISERGFLQNLLGSFIAASLRTVAMMVVETEPNRNIWAI